MISYSNMNVAFSDVMRTLVEKPHFEITPRGLNCRELVGFSFRVEHIRDRLVSVRSRKLSLAFRYAELAWYLNASNSLGWLVKFAPSYVNYSDNGQTLYGAYGPRIGFGTKSDQFREVIELLKRDHDTRQAMIVIRSPADVFAETKDQVCTVCLQFMIRDGRLHLIATMRSNDAWRGLPYDAAFFMTLQEAAAREVGVELGWYQHQAGSLHLYETDLKKAIDVIDEWNMTDAHVSQIEPMIGGYTDLVDGGAAAMRAILRLDLVSSKARVLGLEGLASSERETFWGDATAVMAEFLIQKEVEKRKRNVVQQDSVKS